MDHPPTTTDAAIEIARREFAARGLTIARSSFIDHLCRELVVSSVEDFGPATYGHPRLTVQIRLTDCREYGDRFSFPFDPRPEHVSHCHAG